MPFTFRAEAFGVPLITRRFVRFAENATDMSDAFREVVGILSRATAQNFATRGVSGGSRWRDLKPATVQRKAQLGLDPRILFATERLYHSLVGSSSLYGARSTRTGRFAPGGKDHIEEIGPDEMKWGSTVEYGKFHQSKAPRTRIPYRPPVRLNAKDKRAIVTAIQRGLLGD